MEPTIGNFWVPAGLLLLMLIILLVVRQRDYRAEKLRKAVQKAKIEPRHFPEMKVIDREGNPILASQVDVKTGNESFTKAKEPKTDTQVIEGPPPDVLPPLYQPPTEPERGPPVEPIPRVPKEISDWWADWPREKTPEYVAPAPVTGVPAPGVSPIIRVLRLGPATTDQIAERTGLDWVAVTQQLQPLLLTREVVVLALNDGPILWGLSQQGRVPESNQFGGS